MHRALLLALLLFSSAAHSQELQPRRWSHLPKGSNFSAAAYIYTSADIFFSPSTRVENAKLDMHTISASYLHAFELFGKSARFDIVQAYQDGRWEGTLDGTPASTSRTGLSDTAVRLSINLFGAPPLEGEDFATYRREVADCETIVGIGLTTLLPTGRYLKDRLLNLGNNRFTFRPEIGMVHTRGPWSLELDLATYFFTDNDSFYKGNTLEKDPLFAGQAHLVYTFRPGLWVSTGTAFGSGGGTRINGLGSGDSNNNLLYGAAIGFPISRKLGMKVAYIRTNSLERTGFDSHSIVIGAALMW